MKLIRNVVAYGRTIQAMNVPSAKKKSAIGIHGRAVRRSLGRQAGRDERPDLVEQDRHRQDDPDHDRDLDLDDERVAQAGEEQRIVVRDGVGEHLDDLVRDAGTRRSRRRRPPGSPGTAGCAAPRGGRRATSPTRRRARRPAVGAAPGRASRDVRRHPARAGRRRRPWSGRGRPASLAVIGESAAFVERAEAVSVGSDGSAGAAAGSAAGAGAAATGRRGRRRGAGAAGAGGIGDVSTLTLTASWTSDDALRNSLMLLPSEAPTSGSLPGPRMRSAITRMMTSSRGPGVGMIVVAPAVRDPIECARSGPGGMRGLG